VKPIVLIDVADYWKPFVELIEHAVTEGFAAEAVRRDFSVVARVEDVLPAVGLAAAAAPTPVKV
jgi:predicted Rossmann-fold nucleotide-binding protein